jgi:hypothetical protein
MTRVLESAIGYCRVMFEREMSAQPLHTKPTPAALAWRREATEYQKLRKSLEPAARRKS